MKKTAWSANKCLNLFSLVILTLCLALSGCSGKTEKEENLDNIREGLKEVQSELPQDVGDGVIMESVELSGNNIVYQFEFPEDMLQGLTLGQVLDLQPDLKKEMKANMLKELQDDPTTKELLDMCRKADVGMEFRFRGSNSGDKMDITISTEEL